MVLHDLNNAARYAHHMLAISGGKVFAAGTPEDVIVPELLREVFSVEAEIVPDPRTGVPLCVPYELHHPTTRSPSSGRQGHANSRSETSNPEENGRHP